MWCLAQLSAGKLKSEKKYMNQESGDQPAVEIPQTDDEKVVQSTPDNPAPADESQEIEKDSTNDQSDEANKPKRRGGFQKKIERLERELAAERAAKIQPQYSSKEPDNATAKKPVQSDYQTYDDFIEALTDFKADLAADKKLNERDRQTSEQKQQEQWSQKVAAYNVQAAELRKTREDFDEVIAEAFADGATPQLQAALTDSEMGAAVALYLADNPDELDKLNSPALGIIAVNKIIGRIEAKIEVGKSSGEKAAVKMTKAPPPITPVKAKATSANTPEAAAEKGDYEAYRKARGLK